MLAVRSVFPPARGGGSRRMKKKREKKGDASTALAFPSASAGPRVSESHGKERIRRKVIRRDGTGRYRGPRIKLGYLRNLMPHEPVFGTGEDPRGSLSLLSSPLFRRNHLPPAFIRFQSSRPSFAQPRNTPAGIDTGDRSRVEKANRARSSPRKSSVLNWKEKKRKKEGRKEKRRGEKGGTGCVGRQRYDG